MASRQSMLRKKAKLLHRISLFDGRHRDHQQAVQKRKETKTFTTLTEKVQEALKKGLTVKVTANKIRKPRDDQI